MIWISIWTQVDNLNYFLAVIIRNERRHYCYSTLPSIINMFSCAIEFDKLGIYIFRWLFWHRLILDLEQILILDDWIECKQRHWLDFRCRLLSIDARNLNRIETKDCNWQTHNYSLLFYFFFRETHSCSTKKFSRLLPIRISLWIFRSSAAQKCCAYGSKSRIFTICIYILLQQMILLNKFIIFTCEMSNWYAKLCSNIRICARFHFYFCSFHARHSRCWSSSGNTCIGFAFQKTKCMSNFVSHRV